MNAGQRSRPIEILLVEDNPADVRLAKEVFNHATVPTRLSVAQDGVEALAFLHQEGIHKNAPFPDLILLDLNLPRKNGRETLMSIKLDESLKRIPVVVLTISKAEEDILKAYDLHANCYITKPVDLDQFIRVVKSIENFWLTVVNLPPDHKN